MTEKQPEAPPESFTRGCGPVQSFVSPALPVPPGTPARPRPDRPRFDDDEEQADAEPDKQSA